MRAALPSEGMVARVGGEEFLIAIPATSLIEVRDLADQLRRTVRDTQVPLPSDTGPVQVTVSIGVRLIPRQSRLAGNSVEALIEQADQALYDSKSGGRDTVTVCLRPAA